MTLDAYLKNNSYPGRFLLAGNTSDGTPVAAYAIMGRSENSRNRIFTLEDGVLRTRPFDESKVEDPSLIIYNAGLTSGKYFILTNGDQTDTIKEELEEGRTLASALSKRTYEPDAPNFTSRISALFNLEEGTYSLSIIRKSGNAAERLVWDYPVTKGKAHVIHTYKEDGSPLPAFEGDPRLFDIPSDIDELASLLWSSLNAENRISLYVRVGNEEKIINRNEAGAKAEKLELKYGCNPNQKPAYISREGGLPITVENGKAGYINLLDALNGYQLVRELKAATGLPSAASFKHVSPAGAAIGLELDDTEKKMYFVTSKTELSPLATAYIRARGADRMSSFGDFIALSDVCDRATAKAINREVSDGVIAPGYTEEALEILKAKRNGSYTVLSIDPEYVPDELEIRTVYGITFTQAHNSFIPSAKDFENIVTKNKEFTPEAVRDLTVALITLKYTQSNSVCYAYRGQSIGVGAGQQSRIHCTRLAGSKASLWFLRHSERVQGLPFLKELSRNDKDNVIEQYLSDDPEEDVAAAWQKYFTEPVQPFTAEEKRAYLDTIDGVSLASDAFFPFSDNIDRAHRIGVKYISEPGGSVRDDAVIEAADKYDMVMAFTGVRLFHH